MPPFLKNSFSVIHEARMLPQVAERAITAACHPNAARLPMINLFEPIEIPKMKSRSTMVYEMVFSVFRKKDMFLKFIQMRKNGNIYMS